MNHLESEGASPYFTEASDTRATREAFLLRTRKVEKAQGEKSRSVGDATQHLTAPSVDDFRQLHFAFDHRAMTGEQRADGLNAGPIFVSSGQDEEQILDGRHAEHGEASRERVADSAQRRDRALFSGLSQGAGCNRPRLSLPSATATHRVRHAPAKAAGSRSPSLH